MNYTIKFDNVNGSGKMEPFIVESGKSVRLPACTFKRDGYKFVGWSLKRIDKVYMSKHQLGTPQYKDKAKVKDLVGSGRTVTLYACWKGYSVGAAADWARRIANDDAFAYGVGKEAHHNGCYFCGTNQNGKYGKPKTQKKWNKTYCCNPFVFACLAHGANLYSKCKPSGLSLKFWLGLKVGGKKLYKNIGNGIKVKDLRVGDILLKPDKHVMLYVGDYQVAHAAREGWDDESIRVQDLKKNGKVGSAYSVLRYVGR